MFGWRFDRELQTIPLSPSQGETLIATLRDVAHAARVSPSTVSRALTGSALVSPGTRERVEQAAAKLGYQPSRAAPAHGSRLHRSGPAAALAGHPSVFHGDGVGGTR